MVKKGKKKLTAENFMYLCRQYKKQGLNRNEVAAKMCVTEKTMYNKLKEMNTSWKELDKIVIEKKITKIKNGKKISKKVIKREIIDEKPKTVLQKNITYAEISENSYKKLLLQILNTVEVEDKDVLKTKVDVLKEMRTYLDKTQNLSKKSEEEDISIDNLKTSC